MDYVLVNKNKIIPQIIQHLNKNTLLSMLYDLTLDKNTEYCKNIYVVNVYDYDNIYISNGKHLYQIINDTNVKIDFENIQNELSILTKINNSFNNFVTNNTENIKMIINKNNNSNIVIDDELKNNNSNIIIDDELNKNKIANQDLLHKCKEVKDLYNISNLNIKKIEINLKNLDKKIQSLTKKRRDIIISNLSLIKNEYNTYNKINKNIIDNELDENANIPILFLSKYIFIKKLLLNNNNIKILHMINEMDIEKLYINDDIQMDNDIIIFCNKYNKVSKNLNYKFDHQWDFLGEDDDINSN